MKYLLFLLAACGRLDFGEHVDAGAGSGSGTRLKQQYDVYDGTLRLPTQLYDSLLAATCYAYATSAGTRCLPNSSTVYYLDAACTQAVAPAGTGTYVFDLRFPPVTHAYTFGASMGTPARAYTPQYDGTCAPVAPSEEMFALTEVSFDNLVELTPTYGNEGRLVSSALVAADGFRTPGSLHDTEVNADCFGATFDDRSACFVVPADEAYYYLDSSCTQVADDAYTPVLFSQHLTSVPACKTTDFEVRPLGAELPRTTPVWVQIPGSTACIQTSVGASRRLFALGAPITLAGITRQPVPGARIQAIASTANGASAIDTFAVWDSQLGVECKPYAAADGALRCLPSAFYAQHAGYFTDSACTQPIVGAGVQSPACTTTAVPYLLDLEGGATGRVFHATFMPGPIYGGGPTNCQAYQNTAFYAETTEVPLDNFAVVTQQTDP